MRAVIFDLDGTLVQTEILKAYSYAQAVLELSAEDYAEKEVVEAFKEDSLSGVKAALAADMFCIAVTTDFTHKAVQESGILEDRWIVPEPSQLLGVAENILSIA